MTELLIERPPDETKQVVISAFHATPGISRVSGTQRQIVGSTGITFPRVLWSYGERVYVDVSDPTPEGHTPISVRAEKVVWMNIGAVPETFKRRFLAEIDRLRDLPLEDVETEVSASVGPSRPPPESLSSGEGLSVHTLAYLLAAFTGALVAGTVLAILGLLPGLPGVGEAGRTLFVTTELVGAALGCLVWYGRNRPLGSMVVATGKCTLAGLLGLFPTAVVVTLFGLQGVGATAVWVLGFLGTVTGAYYVSHREQ